ncbi:MAG: hypothetical protein IT258_18640 [Saprospiraceae bacterium]|nr:hypothetical protein [Saprospiraceae bacterium]
MKTAQFPLISLCLLIATAFTAKAHSPPLPIADTITIQFHTGYGLDCNGSGRQCLATQPMAVGEQVAPSSHGVAKAWFDGQGHFVMEIRQVFSTSLYNELDGGTFYLEASVPLSDSVLASLGKNGQSYTVPLGVHPVKKQQDGSYRIVF